MDDIINKLTHDGEYATDVCLLLVLEDANESLHYLDYLNITGKELETLAHDCLPIFDIDHLRQTIRFLRSGFLSMDDVRKNLNSPKPVHFINRLIKVGEDWERVYEEYSYHFYKNLNNNKKGR